MMMRKNYFVLTLLLTISISAQQKLFTVEDVVMSVGALIDWKFYEVMYGERFMDTPQTNPDGYKEASLLNYVENLKGKLLLVHGTSDPTVVWQNTLTFAKKAQELNKPLDYLPYVGHPHGVGGRDALHLYTKITNYFLENL